MMRKKHDTARKRGLLGRVRGFAATAPGRLVTLLIGIGVTSGAVVTILGNLDRIEPLFKNRYYGRAAERCEDAGGYPAALRGANLPLIRCFIESKGRSANDPMPAGGPFANHPPLMLVAEQCRFKTVRYLIDEAGADPRLGHRYDARTSQNGKLLLGPDGKSQAYDTPSGRCLDIPRDVAESKCIGDDPDRPLVPDGPKIVAFLKQAEKRWDSTERDVADRHKGCLLWHTKTPDRKE